MPEPTEQKNTKRAPRREVRFGSLGDLGAELDRLERVHSEGKLSYSGNYTPGQALHHLARWAERYTTGDLPTDLPLPIKIFGRVLGGRLLNKGFPAGLAGPTGQRQPEPDVSFEDGLAYLRAQTSLIEASDLAHKNPMYGRMTHDDVVKLHLRHAELHLSFLDIEG